MGEETVQVSAGAAVLDGDLAVPPNARGTVLFAHGSGSSRHSPRNRMVASVLNENGFATLLVDLLTPEEEVVDARTGEHRFDIDLLADRLGGAITWLRHESRLAALPLGLFGASTGAAAALIAAARQPDEVAAVVSRGGRPDLAGGVLPHVDAPTLLIVGGNDTQVLDLNERAAAQMRTEAVLRVVKGAGHLFEEPGALEEVAELAATWFGRHLHLPN